MDSSFKVICSKLEPLSFSLYSSLFLSYSLFRSDYKTEFITPFLLSMNEDWLMGILRCASCFLLHLDVALVVIKLPRTKGLIGDQCTGHMAILKCTATKGRMILNGKWE